MRQIILDTETTGLEHERGHRIIEIGCIELINRQFTDNYYHQYINPGRKVEQGALEVHGISNEFLLQKPSFQDIVAEFMKFIKDAELIIHNAPFDMGFINSEFKRCKRINTPVEKICGVFDTLKLARKLHPGQRNSLDALCKRYKVDNTNRNLHGALIDAELLGKVYLAMTGGQTSLFTDETSTFMGHTQRGSSVHKVELADVPIAIIHANEDETKLHNDYLQKMKTENDKPCLWLELEEYAH